MKQAKFLIFLVATLCLLLTSIGATEERIITPDGVASESAFEVPDVTIKASDITTVNEIAKDQVEVDAPYLAKESPTIQKNFVFSFLTEAKEVPGVTTSRPIAANGVNSIYSLIGSNGITFRYLYGKSSESEKYFLELEHKQTSLGEEAINTGMTRASGTLSSVLFDNKVDMDVGYTNYIADAALDRSHQLRKDQFLFSADTQLPFNAEYELMMHTALAPYLQKFANSELNGFSWDVSGRTKAIVSQVSPLVYKARLGHLGIANAGLNLFSPGIYFENDISQDNKLLVDLDLPVYWDATHLFSQLSISSRFSQELSESSGAWFRVFRGLDLPGTKELVMRDPFLTASSRLKPEETVYGLEAGYNTNNPDKTLFSARLIAKTLNDPLIVSDYNLDGFPEYMNGPNMNLLMAFLEYSCYLDSSTWLSVHTDLVLSARAVESGASIPYFPFCKGWVGLDTNLEPSLVWQNRLDFTTNRYVSASTGWLPGYLSVESKFKKQFSRTFEGYLAFSGFAFQRYYIYDNIPGEIFSVSTGFSMNF